MFGSVDVVFSNHLGHLAWKQFRKPRSKSRRIRRKWAKDRRNWREVHEPKILQLGNRLVMDPISYAQFKGQVEWAEPAGPGFHGEMKRVFR